MVLKMELNAKKAELLLRSALLDDANNISERFGALLADISVDENDGESYIALDEDLWPEGKLSPQAEAIAKALGLEIEWEGTGNTFPFAWPAIGEHTNKTTEYYELVLDAYRNQKTNRPDG
ncbi:hypothetical protein [Lentilitoribacter sp. EG35]|uniref:hypothetical protein n=1 Tax=Lentilitoribacter sp. EG35 TaxID=3234192 RepID=UPI00345F307B